MNATIDGTAQIVAGRTCQREFFEQMRVRTELGRPILAADDAAGAAPVAVLSETFWRRASGSDAAVVGRVIKVNMVPVTVVGVAQRGFTGAKDVQTSADLFLPFSAQPLVEPRGKSGSLIGQ